MRLTHAHHALASLIAGGLPILVAGVALIGWTSDIVPLKQVMLGPVEMNPMTALAFALAGMSLWLQSVAGSSFARATWWRHVARSAAAAVVAVGSLKLAGAWSGWDWGVDQWLFAHRLADVGPIPNRMALNTALNFVLIGVALLALDVTTRRNRRPSELLACAVALVSLQAVASHIYHVPAYIGLAKFIPMALSTALVFLTLAYGVFVARPNAGMMAVIASPSLGGLLARRLFPIVGLSMLALGWLRLEGERRGWLGLEQGVALYTLANITIFGTMLWGSARTLHREEARRERVTAHRDQALALNRLIMDNSLDVICAIDGEGRFVEVSAAALQLWGYAPSELIGRAYVDLLHPDDVAKTAESAAKVVAGQPTGNFSNRYLRKDGKLIDIDWSAVWSASDGLMFCVARDATARKQAEEYLQQSQAQTQAIIATAADAFVAIDRFGRILDWNASAESIFGWPQDQAIGQQLSRTIIPEQHRQAHDRGLDHYLATGAGPVLNRTIEINALHRDGHEFPVELTIWPVTIGASTTFNAFIRDITSRRQAARAIQALNEELTANAVELQQSNRELESFSYSVSHDLRAPLRHIDGYARMLQEDAGDQLDAEMRRFLDAISDSARQMGTLIDDLLALSKLGRMPVERAEVDMGALVQRVVAELRMAGDPRVSIGPLPMALADPVLFKQVWLNLLSNALKYSATRGDAARVEVTGERDGDRVRYRIRDNGVGFDMRHADKLFGVFQRLHSQDEFEGTGVGLAIVQRIVARHGGSIIADSQPGLGATFTFLLPLQADSETDSAVVEVSR